MSFGLKSIKSSKETEEAPSEDLGHDNDVVETPISATVGETAEDTSLDLTDAIPENPTAALSELEAKLPHVQALDLSEIAGVSAAPAPSAPATDSHEIPDLPAPPERAPAAPTPPAAATTTTPTPSTDGAGAGADVGSTSGDAAPVEVPESLAQIVERVRAMIDSFDLSEDEKEIMRARFENQVTAATLRTEEINRNRADFEKMLALGAENGQVGSAPAGFLSSLFGMNKPRIDKDYFAGLNAQQREVGEDLNAFGTDMQSRFREYKVNRTRENMVGLGVEKAALMRTSDALNEAILTSDPAREALEGYAAGNGGSLEEIFAMLRRGEKPAPVMDALNGAKPAIAADPAVVQAAGMVAEAQDRFASLYEKTMADVNGLHADNEDSKEPLNMAQTAHDEAEDLVQRTDPLLDLAERERFQERMRQLSESIANMIRRMLDRIFGRNSETTSSPSMAM